jgi:hypothetical protein
MVVDATGTVAAPVRWRKSTMHAPRNRAPRPALMAALLAATLAACGGDDGPGPTDQSGRLEGQVVIAGTEAGAGPLVGATVTISQIDENSPTGAVRTVAGTVTTDAERALRPRCRPPQRPVPGGGGGRELRGADDGAR